MEEEKTNVTPPPEYGKVAEAVKEILKTRPDFLEEFLSRQEVAVYTLRSGLSDGTPKTLEEISCRFGITRESARQTDAKAYRKILCRLSVKTNDVKINVEGKRKMNLLNEINAFLNYYWFIPSSSASSMMPSGESGMFSIAEITLMPYSFNVCL